MLIEPLALTRWDVALEAYREASRLYEEFETARRRTQTLEPLPGIAENYRAAGADYVAKNRLLTGGGDDPARIHVWLAGLGHDAKKSLAEFMDAVAIADPADYQRRPALPARRRTTLPPIGTRESGLPPLRQHN
ncbi:MAG TPA: hypothetical protein VMU94_21850 [Streptosporangiaceae bacterium]|nr:hypothetical protein [Streptosporangiaceae bacterium]